ncbi:MAG: tRNA (N(6)-L-threonylcarbamoyladenosine(37)-C(2))-methylthiotransferase MtaB [Bacteroidetes bacterium]|nr:tRNA (N(6)-L-threonylcarbamoyladenosine(37)-C(2))-methylthiotransferase MtaB [Bacteroidota bacterium]
MNVAFKTLGCKLNYAETSTLENVFVSKGHSVVEFNKKSDVVVINTCTVTERADKECRQLIRKALNKSPNAFIIVTGCYAQLSPEEIVSIDGVDLVLGSKEKLNLFDFETKFEKKGTPQIHVSPLSELSGFGPAFSGNVDGRTRAFLKIQDGCDFNCSFCTIPLARGESRSQNINDTITQANHLVENGYKEIVLTGVNVGDYGKKNGANLIELLKNLELISDLRRIRISSIEPNLLNDELLEYWISSEKICKHFHLPLQSGSDDILRKMKRRYSSTDYKNLISKIRKSSTNAGIGVDVICGFPGDDEKCFTETYNFLNNLEVSYLHVFTYSEREKTPSINYDFRIEPKLRFLFSEKLRTLGAKKKLEFYKSNIDKLQNVLFESSLDGNKIEGYTDNYIRVRTNYLPELENLISKVIIKSAKSEYCNCDVI